MDEASLEATINAYKQQLQQIETVLQSAGTEGLDDLLQLKRDLTEVIELTQGSLLSLKKSKLLSYVDDITSETSEQNSKQDGSKAASKEPASVCDMDEEFAAFQAAIADGSASSSPLPARSDHSSEDDINKDDDDEEEDDDEDVEDISGTKCSIIYRHEWGAHQRHNAVVLSVEPPSPDDEEMKVRVLFCNPTNATMKPCPYFFKGECRFSEEECRFSHGYIVNAAELKPFQEVDLSQLSIESKCLAKYDDDIWYPAEVRDIDRESERVTVCFESYGNSVKVKACNILPTGTQDDDTNDAEGDEENDDDSDISDHDLPSTSSPSYSSKNQSRIGDEEEEEEDDVPDVLWVPSGPSCRLGEWETHTRGIGSKIMAMMGYEIGKGLGKHGEGRVEPVEAVIVPAGKSLDTCMKLREMKKLGIVGKKKKKKGKGKRKKKHKDGSGGSSTTKLKKARDVFEFINTHLGAKKVKVNELLADNILLVKSQRIHREENKGESKANTRQLNVQLLKTQGEARSAEKRLVQLKQSLARNQRDKMACATIQSKIARTEEYLTSLQSSQRKLERQKTSRDEHKKLTIF